MQKLEYIVTVGPTGLGASHTHWELDQWEAALQQFKELSENVKRGGSQYASLTITHKL